jgi:hypothetical protein
MRTRKVCKSCFNEQKRLYRESITNKKIIQPVEDLTPTIEFIPPPIDYSTNPDYKRCTVCNEWKHVEDYYYHSKKTGAKFSDCIECHKIKDKREHEEYLENNGGHDRILTKPNQYMDEIQKKQTFCVMEVLGYTFNEEHNIWLKEGVKTIENDNIKFHFLKYSRKPHRGKGMKISQTLKDRVIFYREKGYSMGRISLITGISDSSICKIINEYEKK